MSLTTHTPAYASPVDYPEPWRPEINKLNAVIHHDVSAGVTRFAHAYGPHGRDR